MTIRSLIATLLLSAVATLGVAAAESAIIPPAKSDDTGLTQLVERLSRTPEKKRKAIAKRWLGKGDSKQRFAQAEELLFAGSSADQSEELFLPFVEARLDNKSLSATDRATLEWRRSVCLTNAPGTDAADITFGTPDGTTRTLHEWVAADTATTLLLIYDPECHHCREVIVQLSQQTLPWRVLAVCVETTRQRWLDTLGQLPDEWVKAFDLSNIIVNEQYVIRSMPQTYLINHEGKVVAKNPHLKCMN